MFFSFGLQKGDFRKLLVLQREYEGIDSSQIHDISGKTIRKPGPKRDANNMNKNCTMDPKRDEHQGHMEKQCNK